MRFIISLLFFCTNFSIYLSAQSSITWGKPVEVSKKSGLESLAFSDKEGTVLWRYEVSTFGNLHISTIEAYGPDGKPVAQVAPPEEYNGERIIGIRVFGLAGKTYLLFAGKSAIQAWQLDRKTLAPQGSPINLFNLPWEYDKRDMNLFLLHEFDGAFNHDTTEMVLTFRRVMRLNKQDTTHLTVYVFGPTLSPLWEKEILLEGDVNLTGFLNHFVTYEKGVVAIASKKALSKEEWKKMPKGVLHFSLYHYQVILFKDKGKTVQYVPVSLEDEAYINSMDLQWQPDGSLLCMGSYTLRNESMASQIAFADRGDKRPGLSIEVNTATKRARPLRVQSKEEWAFEAVPVAGMYCARISPEGQLVARPTYSPLLPLISKNKARYEKKSQIDYEDDKELHGFEPVCTSRYTDGTAVILFECKMPMKKLYTNKDRFCCDILAVAFDSEGKAAWGNVIPKYQRDDNWVYPENVSFGLMHAGQLLHFIYLDDARSDASLYRVTLNSKGELSEPDKLAGPNSIALPMPRYGIQTGPDRFVLPAGQSDKFRIGVLKL